VKKVVRIGMMLRKPFTISLKVDLIDQLDRIAEKDNRSRSNVVEMILLKYFEEHPEIGLEKKDEL